MKYIKTAVVPDESAHNAYEKGFYVEALQILHCWLENQSQELLMLIGAVYFKSNTEKVWNLTNEVSFTQVLKILRILNQITENEYIDFKKFNTLRNKVIHDIYKEKYNEFNLGIDKENYDLIYQKTLEQAYFFTNKSAELVEKKN